MKLRWLIPLLFVLPAFGVGGTCPSGANYTNPSNPTGSLVTLSSLGITSCYFVAANGSDSNDGKSEASGHPFLHSPGMQNCGTNCSVGLLAPGIGIIFRGGDTWHFGNSGASPYAGVVSTCADNGNNAAGLCIDDINGTSGNGIYFGVDPTWFTGGSWVRPILTADNPPCNATGGLCTSNPSSACLTSSGSACTGLFYVSICTYQIGNTNNLVDVGFSKYITVDNFELTGLCQNHLGQPSGFDDYVNYGAAQAPLIFTNLYIHGWSHTQFGSPNGQPNCHGVPDSCVNIEAFHGSVNNGSIGDDQFFNIVDGADSDPVGGWVGFNGGYNAAYNVFRYVSGNDPGDVCTWHDNLYEFLYGNGHTNGIESQDLGCNGGSTVTIYNNVFRHMELAPYGDQGVILWWGPVATTTTDYIFNNIAYDIGQAEYLNIGATGLTVNQGHYVFFNDTWQSNISQSILNCNVQTTGTTVDTNNHYIDDVTPYVSCPALTSLTAKVMTNATATADGYTSVQTYAYAPTAGSSPTVGTGTNENTAYCGALTTAGLTAAASACQSDTSYGVSYNATSHTISFPARTDNARPSSTAWDVGAYEFAGGPPAASAPTFFPVAGTYYAPFSATLSTTSSGAIICYNTTGAPATNGTTGCTTGTLYTTPVLVPTSETLYAVAGGAGYTDSSVASAVYKISPQGGAAGMMIAGTVLQEGVSTQ